jgi:nucleoside-diphosphate-sugar epimerase
MSAPTSDLVLVTGASGFIATHCVVKLLDSGYRVRGSLRTPARGASVREAVGRALGREVSESELSFVAGDLSADDGWTAAVDGCRFVLHVASPVPRKPPKKPDDLIVPARDGALRVLRAAAHTGVERVVMTSSVAAVIYGHARDGSRVFDESDWTEIGDGVGAYEQSKTIAERAAWDFVEGLPAESRLELVTINPGLVLGPILDADYGTSGELVRKLMRREMPGLPDVGWAMVDVRDVADAHVAAMTAESAAGRRFICAIEHASLSDVAEILRAKFGDRYKIPSRRIPGWVLRFASIFDKTARLAVPELGKRQDVSNERIRSVLAWQPRTLEEMVVAMGESMIEHGVV